MHSALALALAFSALVSGAAAATATGPRTKCTETYRPDPTDTCASISSWSRVPVSSIAAMNPGMPCTAPLAPTVCLQQYTPACTQWIPAWETTCNDLASQYLLSVSDFVALNANVNSACTNLHVGSDYCTSTADCFIGNTDPLCSGHSG